MADEATLYVGDIITMDEGLPRAEAMLVQGDRVVAVGSRQELVGRGVKEVDLSSGVIIPGFNDCHAHILSLGLALNQVDVTADAVRTIADIQRAVAARLPQTASGAWILGRGYDQNMLNERRHPTRWDLDAASAEVPVMLGHTSGHVLACNSRALQLAGIDRNTDDPPGGVIDRDEHGEPTGVLKESAMERVHGVIPDPSGEEAVKAIRDAMTAMSRYGITSATDLSTPERAIAAYRHAVEQSPPSLRIGLCPQITHVAPPDSEAVHPPAEYDAETRPEWLNISATKIFSDGAMSTRTAALREPYIDDRANVGILLWPEDTLESMMRRAHEAGWQIATHALGDRAVAVVLECYARAMSARPRSDHRHRIEHCMVLDEDLVRGMKAQGIVPVIQPDIHRLGDGYVSALGLERASQVIPMRIFDRVEITAAFSSDTPVIPCNPLEVVLSAMERRTPGGVVLGQEHAVSALEGIRHYTRGSAFATRWERDKGAIRPGMLADVVVLSHDPAGLPVDDFRSLRVLKTIIGGREVYAE